MDFRLRKQVDLNDVIAILFFLTILSLFAFSNITLLSISTQFIFLSTMILYSIHKNQVRLTIHFIWWIVFIFWGLIVTIFSQNILSSSLDLINIFLKVLFLTSLIIYIDSEKKVFFALKSIVLAGGVLFLRVVIFTPTNDWGTERLGSAIDLNANALGVALAYASICSVFLAKKINKKYYFFLIPFISMGVMTGSRKAILMILGGISLLMLLSLKKKENIIFTIPLIFLFIIGIYVLVMNIPMFYNVLGTRIEGLSFFSSNTEMDASTQTRTMMIVEAWNLFTQSPILGHGLESFREISYFGTYSHNNYTELLVSTGAIGTIIYYSLPLGILFSSLVYLKNKNRNFSIIIVILTIILIMDYTMVTYKHVITHVLIALSFSYYLILKEDKHELSKNEDNNKYSKSSS